MQGLFPLNLYRDTAIFRWERKTNCFLCCLLNFYVFLFVDFFFLCVEMLKKVPKCQRANFLFILLRPLNQKPRMWTGRNDVLWFSGTGWLAGRASLTVLSLGRFTFDSNTNSLAQIGEFISSTYFAIVQKDSYSLYHFSSMLPLSI